MLKSGCEHTVTIFSVTRPGGGVGAIPTIRQHGAATSLARRSKRKDGQRLLEALRSGGHVIYSRLVATHQGDVTEALKAEQWDVILLRTSLPDLPADRSGGEFDWRNGRPMLPVV